MRTPIPPNAWIRYRKQGRYLYGQNKTPICWESKPPPPGTKVYTLVWHGGQHSLMASGSIVMPEENKT